MGEYRDSGVGDDPDMSRVPGRLRRQMPCMLAFLEQSGAGPTSNAGKGALLHTVVFRKIIGKTRGGPRAMGWLADFVTRVPTWRRHGKRSVCEEAARLI